MDNTPKKLNKNVLITLIALQVLAIGYCLIHDNLKINSMDFAINVYTDNKTIIIYANRLDIGFSSFDDQTMKGCSLFNNGCYSRPMMRPEFINKNNGDLIL